MDFAFEEMSARAANVSNSLSARPRPKFDIGVRDRFPIARAPATLRLQPSNIFNTCGWSVNPSGGLTYTRPRVILSEFQLDF